MVSHFQPFPVRLSDNLRSLYMSKVSSGKFPSLLSMLGGNICLLVLCCSDEFDMLTKLLLREFQALKRHIVNDSALCFALCLYNFCARCS